MANKEEVSEIAVILGGNVASEDESPVPDEADQADESQAASEETDDAEQQDETPTKLTVKELAEKLDLTPEQLYGALQIKVGDTEVSLSTLKDGVNDLDRANELRESAQAHKTESENDILRQRRELTLARERYQPTEAEANQAEADFQAYTQRENAAALQVIPEWSDPAKQQAGINRIANLMEHYAFGPAETQTMVDHRFLKLMNDYSLIRERLTKAEKSVKDTQRQPSKARRRTPQTGSDKAVQLHKAGKLDKTSTIAAIIAEGTK